MKRFLFVVAGALLIAVPVLMAGDYHSGDDLVCQECHVMHYSQAHGYNSNGTGPYTTLGSGGPFEYLLRDNINDLCLACHNGMASAPDVLEAQTGTVVRQAGALNLNDANPYFAETGHTLNVPDVAPGGSWAPDTSTGFVCTHCHEPHGEPGSGNPDTTGLGQYRNMRSDPGDSTGMWVLYAVGTNDNTRSVFERSAASYHVDSVDFNEPLATGSRYAAWCQSCHTNFHGTSGSSNMGGSGGIGWLRHPTADADIGDVGGNHSSAGVFASRTNKVKVMTGTDNWDPDTSEVTDHTPSCFSCHKAHGNQNAFGLIFMKGTGTVDEEGDDGTEVRDLCKQCHTQG